MGEKSYGKLVAEELVRAITRALVYSIALLCIVNIVLGTLRQEAKEAIEYAAATVIDEAMYTIHSDPDFNQLILPKIKQNAKEAIEFAAAALSSQPAFSADGKRGVKK